MPVLIVGSLLVGGFFSTNSPKSSKPAIIGYQPEPPKRRHFIGLIPLGICLAVLNLIFGDYLSGVLIYNFGTEGRAIITGSHPTSTQYNDHNVVGYDVLIKTADDHIVETGFEDDDFNVYPSHNETIYPGVGDKFNVRYIQHSPKNFVILARTTALGRKGCNARSYKTSQRKPGKNSNSRPMRRLFSR
jgi:hypothetical protein